jgi:hypothetical protein
VAVDMEWLKKRTAERLAELRAAIEKEEGEASKDPEAQARKAEAEATLRQAEAKRQSRREALVIKFGPGWDWSAELQGFTGPAGEYVREGLAEDWIVQRDMDKLAAQMGLGWKWVHGAKKFQCPWSFVPRYTEEQIRKVLQDKPGPEWEYGPLGWQPRPKGSSGGFAGFEHEYDKAHRRQQEARFRQARDYFEGGGAWGQGWVPPRPSRVDWRQVLGVAPMCTWEQARTAYRSLAKQHHEAVGGDQEKMKQINAAWDDCKKYFGKRG